MRRLSCFRQRPRRRQRVIALLTVFAYCGIVSLRCASFGAGETQSEYETLRPLGEQLPPPPANFEKLRVVLLDFKNDAQVSRFDVIPDGDYSDYIANVSSTPATPQLESPNTQPTDDVTDPANGSTTDTEDSTDDSIDEGDDAPQRETIGDTEPETVDSGVIAREITETTLFQSGRFEIVPEFQFRGKVDAALAQGLDRTAAIQAAADELDVACIVYGSLTDFEIRQQQDYWKLPLWAILLAGSFLIQDDDLRVFVWYTMLRIALVVPLNSPVWDYGVQWNNLDINVDVAMNLRVVDARSGSVVYSESDSVTRVENVRNLNLMVWSSNRRIKITQSNAGRQMRYVAQNLVRDLAAFADEGRLSAVVAPIAPPANQENR